MQQCTKYEYLPKKQPFDRYKQFSRDGPNKIFQFCLECDQDGVIPAMKGSEKVKKHYKGSDAQTSRFCEEREN